MATVEQTMMKVQRLLTGPMGLRIQLAGDTITVAFSDSSTAVHLRVIDGGQNDEGDTRTFVRITSPILRSVRPSPELFEWVAKEAGYNWFGHVAVSDDTNEPGKLFVMMIHTLLGDFLDEGELEAAMFGVLSSADHWDDELKKRFGGKRWADE